MPIPEAFAPDLTRWQAWRPDDVARLLADVQAPWYVAAGWAIDLFLGGERRHHEDLEIAVPRARFGEVVQAFARFDLFVIESGLAWPLTEAGERLETSHQTWVRDPATSLWRLDIFREPSDGDTWVCRRDERIRLPYDDVIEHTEDGIPYGKPEIVLLFKAKHAHRRRDQADFAAVLPLLEPAQRRWLAEALVFVHPAHPWLEQVASA